jgi:hypothetical protein
MQTHWRREDPQFFDMYSLPWGESSELAILHGVETRLLSRDSGTEASTYMVRLDSGWAHTETASDATVECFVLEGSLSVDNATVGAGGFIAIPRGCGSVELSSEAGATLFLFWNPTLPTGVHYNMQVHVTKTWQQPWLPVDMPGLRHGMMHKPLRVPDSSVGPFHGSPGGLLRLLLMTPSFALEHQEIHHGCWEEIFFLTGDFLMPERGLTGPGTVLCNPADYKHGPYYTQRGTVLLVHSDAPMPAVFFDYAGARELGAQYFDTTSWLAPPVAEQWETRPERHLLARIASEEGSEAHTPREGVSSDRG